MTTGESDTTIKYLGSKMRISFFEQLKADKKLEEFIMHNINELLGEEYTLIEVLKKEYNHKREHVEVLYTLKVQKKIR